jgi:aerobic carbon-monoxide dehydrogenase medium subunit
LKAPRFHYVRPETLGEALKLLAEHGEEARILAGGQSLMPTLNMRLSHPQVLIDINRIDSLTGIALREGMVRIGALARHVEVMNSPVIATHLPLIAEAMPHVAHVAVRNRGTFGGSVALADPAAELPACVLALGATLVVESVRGKRSIAADDYFLGLYETARAPDELLVEVLIPPQQKTHVSVFMELARRHGDFAMAGLACIARIKGDVIDDARLAYFGSEDRPVLGKRAMAAVTGKSWSDASRDAVRTALADDLDPMDNTFGTPATKLHLQQVLTARALDKAVERARLP